MSTFFSILPCPSSRSIQQPPGRHLWSHSTGCPWRRMEAPWEDRGEVWKVRFSRSTWKTTFTPVSGIGWKMKLHSIDPYAPMPIDAFSCIRTTGGPAIAPRHHNIGCLPLFPLHPAWSWLWWQDLHTPEATTQMEGDEFLHQCLSICCIEFNHFEFEDLVWCAIGCHESQIETRHSTGKLLDDFPEISPDDAGDVEQVFLLHIPIGTQGFSNILEDF